MATRKNLPANPQFVVRIQEDTRYWSDTGHGFNKELTEATRFNKEDGIRKLGEILHNSGTVCELVDVTIPYECPVLLGTVVLNEGVAEIITAVPQIKGGTLTLFSPTIGSRELRVQDFLEELHGEYTEILWDPHGSLVPESNEDYLNAYDFIKDGGGVGE